MKKQIIISISLFLLGALLLFMKFWHHSYPSYVVWWTTPLFENLYFILIFSGVFSFLAILVRWIFRDYQILIDRNKLAISCVVLVLGYICLFLNLWQTTHTSFTQGEMWWQREFFEIIYRLMFIGGAAATSTMLVKIVVRAARHAVYRRTHREDASVPNSDLL